MSLHPSLRSDTRQSPSLRSDGAQVNRNARPDHAGTAAQIDRNTQLYDQFLEIVSRRLSDSARLASDVLKDHGKNDDDDDTDVSAVKQQSEGR